MKKCKIITLLSILLLISANKLTAENLFHLGFSAGLAIPNEKVAQFFDDAKQEIQTEDNIKHIGRFLFEKATTIGYNIKLQGVLELSEHFTFAPSVGIARFNEGLYELVVPFATGDTVYTKTQSTANVVPISAGFNVYLFRRFISPYVNADLVYNYITYSYDILFDEKIAAPIFTSKTLHRLGYAFGAGIEIDLSLISLSIEAKYNVINLIRYDSQEPQKRHYTFTVGIIF